MMTSCLPPFSSISRGEGREEGREERVEGGKSEGMNEKSTEKRESSGWCLYSHPFLPPSLPPSHHPGIARQVRCPQLALRLGGRDGGLAGQKGVGEGAGAAGQSHGGGEGR